MNYPLTMKYMEWSIERHKIETRMKSTLTHPFDGSDMVLAMNKMNGDKIWSLFFTPFAYQEWKELIKPATADEEGIVSFIVWLMQPERFFTLMEQALKEGVIGK